MALSKCVIFKILVFSLIFIECSTKPSLVKKQIKKSEFKLIVISLDGLMFEQIQPNSMPFVTEFYKNGVHCPRMQPVFPTKTLVNHFSIATGLYPGSHGVTANLVYDNEKQKLLKYSPEIFMYRQNVTPIWTLNELAGRHSAVSMWSAGEFAFRGTKPTYIEPFNRKTPWKQRIDNLIPILKRNASQVDFVMFYSEHPDFEDHAFSPSSQQVFDILKDTDKMVKYLSEQLEKEGLSNVTDIIILSDHGMDTYYFNHESFDESIIDLNRVVSETSCDMYGSSPVLQVIARDGYNQSEICLKLKSAAKVNGNYTVYMDDELKAIKHWHIENGPRFGPCTVVGKSGHVFQDITALLKKWTDYKTLVYGTKYGVHGYDSKSPIMQAVFLANGPRFKSGVEIPFIENIDLFHLFARLLNIESLTNDLGIDGTDTIDTWNLMLKEKQIF